MDSTVWKFDFGTVAFVDQIYYVGFSSAIDTTDSTLNINQSQSAIIQGYGLDGTFIYENEAASINALFQDSAVGDSTMDVYISYQIITL